MRIEDALAATRAAVDEGVVPGGGSALIRCLEAVSGLKGDVSFHMQGVQATLTPPGPPPPSESSTARVWPPRRQRQSGHHTPRAPLRHSRSHAQLSAHPWSARQVVLHFLFAFKTIAVRSWRWPASFEQQQFFSLKPT